MRFKLLLCEILLLIPIFVPAESKQSFYDFRVKDIQGKEFDLGKMRGSVVLVVNTASKCGFTPQFRQLEEIYQRYKEKGFTILAFPSNDFRQDKGTNEEIENFAKSEYKISFPIMEKNSVAGSGKQPIYQFLTDSKSGFLFKEVQWNFEKFLVGKDGQVIDRWNSMTKPDSKDIIEKIETALKTTYP